MASRPVRIGIIGTGSVARDQHAPACVIAENAELHSILSRSKDRAHDFAHEFSTGKKINESTDINGFLADPLLDAVIIASPDSLHFEHAKACLEAGKHVLVEKPLVINQQDGIEPVQLEIVAAAVTVLEDGDRSGRERLPQSLAAPLDN